MSRAVSESYEFGPFLLDPAGNALEFKAMAKPAKLFAKT